MKDQTPVERVLKDLENGICHVLQHQLLKRILPYVILALLIAFMVNVSAIALKSGALETSSGNEGMAPDSTLTLAARHEANSGYEAARNLVVIAANEIGQSLLGKPAYGHAVKYCTHSKTGVISNRTGGGYHLTKFRGHWDGRHHTRTWHMVLTSSGYQAVDSYNHSEPISVCG